MFDARILQPSDGPALAEFELQSSVHKRKDEMEFELSSWHASWREESLNHYLPLGWSFGIWAQGTLRGYFLAQPMLFIRGFTQTLWIERITALADIEKSELLEIAYRLAREKHLQNILINTGEEQNVDQSIFQLKKISDNIMELKTARY